MYTKPIIKHRRVIQQLSSHNVQLEQIRMVRAVKNRISWDPPDDDTPYLLRFQPYVLNGSPLTKITYLETWWRPDKTRLACST